LVHPPNNELLNPEPKGKPDKILVSHSSTATQVPPSDLAGDDDRSEGVEAEEFFEFHLFFQGLEGRQLVVPPSLQRGAVS